LGARVSDFFQNTSFFTLAVSSGRTGRTSFKIVGIAKDAIVLNVILGLMTVGIEMISRRFAIVTNLFLAIVAVGKAALVAHAQFGRTIAVLVLIVTHVNNGIEKVKGGL
jgi:hypothetical protein